MSESFGIIMPRRTLITDLGWSGPVAGAAADSAAYTNFIARTTGLDAAHLGYYKTLLDGMTTDGLFNSDGTSSFLDVFLIFAAQDATTALVNIPNGTYTQTTSGGPAFTLDRGYAGNGSNANISSSFNPATAGGNYTRDLAHISVWNLSNISDSAQAVSEPSSLSPHIYPKFSGDSSFYARLNEDTSAGYGVIADPRGFLLGSRTASNLTTGYRNAVSLGTVSDASAAINNAAVNILGNGNTAFSSYQLAAVSLGAGLTGTQVTNFYNRLRTYMTAVGVP